jgi:hypothetical protein
MEKVGKFNFSIAKPGVKPSSAVEAGITLTPTINKLVINGLATKVLGLIGGTGDKEEEKTPENSITILVDEDSVDLENKFYITNGVMGDSAKLAAHENEQGAGKELGCTYSGIYARMFLAAVNNDATVPVVPKDRLRMLGFAKGNTALKKVYWKIDVENGIKTEIGGDERTIYRLYSPMITDHTPKRFKE